MTSLWIELSRLLEQGESLCLATLVGKAGSAPRGVGAKMLVRRSGGMFGTVGGGRLEAEMLRAAPESFSSGLSRVIPFDLSGTMGEDKMVCGGAGEVFLEFVDAGNPETVAVFRSLKSAADQGRKCWLLTALDPAGHAVRDLVLEDGAGAANLGIPSSRLGALLSDSAVLSEPWGDRRLFVELIRIPDRVFIFGAGHVGRCIAPVAESVGFQTTVVDDRPELATAERFPSSRVMVVDSFERLPDLAWDSRTYAVIVTRGNATDMAILEQVLRYPVAYVGMMGSRRKRKLVFQMMLDRGVAPERLAIVRNPIGIDIRADTPEEIAVSVVAELIAVRAGL